MVQRLRTRSKQLRDLGVKQAPFVVLIGAGMPSVLAEISFITHKQEGALLKTAAYRQQIAQALLRRDPRLSAESEEDERGRRQARDVLSEPRRSRGLRGLPAPDAKMSCDAASGRFPADRRSRRRTARARHVDRRRDHRRRSG